MSRKKMSPSHQPMRWLHREGIGGVPVIFQLLALAVALGVPILSTLAARRLWATRHEIAPWRRAAGFASILITFLGWLALALLTLGALRSNTSFFSPDWTLPFAATGMVAVFLALLVKGTARILAVLAGALTTLLWLTSTIT
jgi:hypothetical protein